MKLTISQKLFAAFLGLTLLVLIATLGLARWSFERGFQGYIITLEQTRLERISRILVNDYIDAGHDWSQIPVRRLERTLSILPRPLKRSPPQRRGGKGPLSEKRNGKQSGFPDGHKRPPPPHKRGKHRPPHIPPSPPTALLDTANNLLAGHEIDTTSTQFIRVPIIVDDMSVGALISEPKRRFESSLETAFSRKQLITSILIGIASLLLAAIVSWLLARRLIAPVKRMIGGVKQLSGGDYKTHLNNTRNDELGQLTNDINHLATTLAANQHSRRRWLADISHELRTPVTILTGEIAALQEGIRPLNQQQVASLGHEVDRLRHLIDDLYQLSLSDMGALRYDFALCDLDHNVRGTVNSLSGIAQENGIEIHIDSQPDTLVHADSSRIDQLLTNLIQNSLSYTNSPGQLNISLKHIDKQIVLEMEDTPPGVSEEECQKIFEALYRKDESRSRRTAGAGLGLAICQNIVKAHRGVITAQPSPLGGLNIRVSFPKHLGDVA